MTAYLAGTPTLETERLTLRAPGPQDWEAVRDFMLDDRSRFIRDGETWTPGRAWRSFCHIVGTWAVRGYGSFVMCRKGSDDALGLVGPWHPVEWPEPEIGWTVWRAEAEGQGYAFEAATATRNFAFDVLGWTTAVSYIDPENTRSVKLAERLGAIRDPDAPLPGENDWEGVLVYRHPKPGSAA